MQAVAVTTTQGNGEKNGGGERCKLHIVRIDKPSVNVSINFKVNQAACTRNVTVRVKANAIDDDGRVFADAATILINQSTEIEEEGRGQQPLGN